MTPSDEAVERAARALHEELGSGDADDLMNWPGEKSWDEPTMPRWKQWIEAAEAALTAAEPAMIGEIERLRAALHNCLPLVRLKFGNLDPDVNAVMADAVAALATEPMKEG